MAHIRKRGNIWWIYYYEQGKLKGRSLHTRRKREAQAMKRAYESALTAGEPVPDAEVAVKPEADVSVDQTPPRVDDAVQPFDIVDEVALPEPELTLGPSFEPEDDGESAPIEEAQVVVEAVELPDEAPVGMFTEVPADPPAEVRQEEAEAGAAPDPGWIHARKSQAGEPTEAPADESEKQEEVQEDVQEEAPSTVEWEREETASADLDVLESDEEVVDEPEAGEQGWLF